MLIKELKLLYFLFERYQVKALGVFHDKEIDLSQKYRAARQILTYSNNENFYRSVVFSQALEVGIQIIFLRSMKLNNLSIFMEDTENYYNNMLNVFVRCSKHQNASHVVQTSLAILSHICRIINDKKQKDSIQQIDDKLYLQFLKKLKENLYEFYDVYSIQVLTAIYQCEMGTYVDTNSYFILKNYVYCNNPTYKNVKSKYFEQLNQDIIIDINKSDFWEFLLQCNSKFSVMFLKQNIDQYKDKLLALDVNKIITDYKDNQNFQYLMDNVIQLKEVQELSNKLYSKLITFQFEELLKQPLIYLYQSVIMNIQTDLFYKHLEITINNFEAELSIEFYNKLIQNTISAIKQHLKNVSEENQVKLANLQMKIMTSAKNYKYFVYNYLFPNKNTNQLLDLDFQFNKNDTFAIKYLNFYKKDITDEELKEVIELKRQEYIKLEEAQKKIELRERGKKIHYKFNENGVWNVGKEIIMAMFQCKIYSSYTMNSFARSFLQIGNALQRNNLMQLLQHPGGWQVIEVMTNNTYIPVQYKILIYQQLKPQNKEENVFTETKFGRILLYYLGSSIKQHIGLAQKYGDEELKAINYQVNITILAEMCQFIQRKYSFLFRLQETQRLVDMLDYNTYISKNDLWIKTLEKHFQTAEKKVAKKSIKQ